MQGILFLFFLAILSANTILAQYNTGNDDLNKALVKIDADASVNFGAFKTDITGSYNISDQKLDYLVVKVGMTAADIYMTLEIAKISGVSIDRVVEHYQIGGNKGWGVIAKELGIKPGSAEFHALKGNGNKGNGNKVNKGKGKKG